MPTVDREIKDRKEAKAVIRQCMRNIAKNAAVARNVSLKFYPQATVVAANIQDITGRAQDLVKDYESFPE